MAESNYLYVAAIDFGTCYSGYAFSSYNDFKQNPLQIYANQAWNAGSISLLSLKTPTCLLLNSDKSFWEFGYKAENIYADLVRQNKHRDCYYFTRFKMILYQNKNLSKDLMIEDIGGKAVSALDVFSLSIRALKDHLFSTLCNQVIDIKTDDILCVLTVPAIWNDHAKLFMRKSAEQAGIPPNKLFIALEPEAASIYCQYLPTQKRGGAEPELVVAPVGTKYMMVDLGGGTADITVHEKINDGRLKEIFCATGGSCGGTSVDTEFFNLMEKVTSQATMKDFKREHLEEYFDLARGFEYKKRGFLLKQEIPIHMHIPLSTLDLVCRKHLNKTFTSLIDSSDFSPKMSIQKDKIRFEFNFFISLFESTITSLKGLISAILSTKECDGIYQIVLVGGFSECELVREAIRNAFPQCKIIVPVESALAVMKGAVLFGHKPDVIAQRISRFTYGFSKKKPFDPAIHDYNHLEKVNGEEKCTHLFEAFIKRHELVETGKSITTSAKSRPTDDGLFKLRIFQTQKERPMYTDEEGCSLLALIKVQKTNPTTTEKIKVQVVLGGTEIQVKISEPELRMQCRVVIEMP